MLLSQKLHALREEINNAYGLTEEMSKDFAKAIQEVETLEQNEKTLTEIENKISQYYDEGSEKQGDLIVIGEFVCNKLGFLN